ncbi:MAG: hypothetical protein NVV63_12585 [Opitutus sp.]|nr:hypothetical protein [Opitutus sp.]
MNAPITDADRQLAIKLVRLYMDMGIEGVEGRSSVPTAQKINQLLADHRATLLPLLREAQRAIGYYSNPHQDRDEAHGHLLAIEKQISEAIGVDCPECGGSGEYSSEAMALRGDEPYVCSRCNGTGLVPDWRKS